MLSCSGRNYGCEGESVRECLLSKTSRELVDGIPWVQYPTWNAMTLLDMPVKDLGIGAVLINDG